MLSVLPSFAQKRISLSQLKDTEWEQILDSNNGSTRTLRFSSDLAIWSNKESSGIYKAVLNETYYLVNEEPIRPSSNDEFLFDPVLVGKNQEGKFIMVYNNKTETTNYYIIKDYTSTYLYLEVPAFYLFHNGEKVYLSESRTITLKKIRKLPNKPQPEFPRD